MIHFVMESALSLVYIMLYKCALYRDVLLISVFKLWAIQP